MQRQGSTAATAGVLRAGLGAAWMSCRIVGRFPQLALLLLVITVLHVGCSPLQAPAPTASPANTITVTDIVGRSITLKAPIEKMILGEARLAYLVAVLDKDDPFKRLLGWPADLRVNDFDGFNKYKEKFPRIAEIPEFGAVSGGAFSVEKAIELEPDVVVLSFDNYGPARETVAPH